MNPGPRRTKVVALLFSVLFAFALAEVMVRLIGYRPSSLDPQMFTRNADLLLPYQLKKDYHGYYGGAEFRVDGVGNRRVVDQLSPSSAEREQVLLLGDSVVFGQGLRDEDTLASQLQKASLDQQPALAITNIGVPGYSSWNEYAALRDHLLQSTPSTVVLVYVPNDITFEDDYFGIGRGHTPSYGGAETRQQQLRRLIYSNVYVVNLVRESIRSVSAGPSATQATSEQRDLTADERAIAHSMEALRRISEACKDKNIRFSVAIYRDVLFLSDDQMWLNYERAISNKLHGLGIDTFVIKSHTTELSASEVRVSWNDPHPSGKAAHLMALEILKHLRTQSAGNRPKA